MDACDQRDVDAPHYGSLNPKDWDSAARIKTKLGAIMFHGDAVSSGVYYYPIDSERTTKGANFWCTVLCHAIGAQRQRLSDCGRRFGKVFYLQCDSASDNRNFTVACFTEWLVRNGTFHKVKVSFLPVGHTHEDIDAMFGRLSKAIHHAPQSELVKTWEDAFKIAKKATRSSREMVHVVVRFFRVELLRWQCNDSSLLFRRF